MAGALDFLDTLVNRTADVAVAKANADVQTARVGDQTAVPHTSPLQVDGTPLGGYLPLVLGVVAIGVVAMFLLHKR